MCLWKNSYIFSRDHFPIWPQTLFVFTATPFLWCFSMEHLIKDYFLTSRFSTKCEWNWAIFPSVVVLSVSKVTVCWDFISQVYSRLEFRYFLKGPKLFKLYFKAFECFDWGTILLGYRSTVISSYSILLVVCCEKTVFVPK